MSNEDVDNDEGSGQEGAKPTITIAEKQGSQAGNTAKETITIAEKDKPKKP